MSNSRKPRWIRPPESHPQHPAGSYEIYECPCPRCGYPDSRDDGPYEYDPLYDDQLGGPPDPEIHLMWCGRCGKPFDAGTAAAEARAAERAKRHR